MPMREMTGWKKRQDAYGELPVTAGLMHPSEEVTYGQMSAGNQDANMWILQRQIPVYKDGRCTLETKAVKGVDVRGNLKKPRDWR